MYKYLNTKLDYTRIILRMNIDMWRVKVDEWVFSISDSLIEKSDNQRIIPSD